MGDSQSSPCGSCHDQQWTSSDAFSSLSTYGAPFIPECEVFYEGGPDAVQLVQDCEKNPGHPNFIPVKELTKEHLPSGHQTDEVMEYIRQQINTTVKITVKFTSYDRPDTYPNSSAPYPYSAIKGSRRAVRCGTGVFVFGPVEKFGSCPCHSCKTSGKPEQKYLLGVVSTAAHVVFDDAEATSANFELYYDSEENKDQVKCLDGVELFKDGSKSLRKSAGSKRRDFDISSEQDEVGYDNYSYSSDVSGSSSYDGCESDNDDASSGDEEGQVVVKKCHQDRMWVLCATHDLSLLQIMKNNDGKAYPSNKRALLPRKYGVIISHPHGLSKHVSFGHILNHRYPLSPDKTTDVPYQFRAGVMCRARMQCNCSNSSSSVSEIEIIETLQLLHQFLKSDTECKLGAEYKLKHCISILPPPNANFLSESVFQKGCADYWVRFHPETKFALKLKEEEGGDREEVLTYYALPDVEFNFFKADFNFYTGLSYATYDIDTCPGSSGAVVLFTEIKEFHGQHSGALGNRTNRSALDFY